MIRFRFQLTSPGIHLKNIKADRRKSVELNAVTLSAVADDIVLGRKKGLKLKV